MMHGLYPVLPVLVLVTVGVSAAAAAATTAVVARVLVSVFVAALSRGQSGSREGGPSWW